MIVIKSIKNKKFHSDHTTNGKYRTDVGLAFYDTETNEFISGNDKNGSTKFPYVPAGGRSACEQILNNPGDFFKLQPRVKSIN